MPRDRPRTSPRYCGWRRRRQTAAPASRPSRPSGPRGPAARIAARTCAARFRPPWRARWASRSAGRACAPGSRAPPRPRRARPGADAPRCRAWSRWRGGRIAPPRIPYSRRTCAPVEVERVHEPERLLLNEALDVLAADQRQVLAEFRPVEIEQHGAVAHLLLRHLVEDLGGGRIFLAQPFGKAAVDAAVLVLVGDGKREDFLFAELGKAFHGHPAL